MGTNYYLVDRCKRCGRSDRTHIGKQSGGWRFLLHTYEDLTGWISWREHINNMRLHHGHRLENEYGEQVTLQLLDRLVNDSTPDRLTQCDYSTPDRPVVNHGTYDSMAGEEDAW